MAHGALVPTSATAAADAEPHDRRDRETSRARSGRAVERPRERRREERRGRQQEPQHGVLVPQREAQHERAAEAERPRRGPCSSPARRAQDGDEQQDAREGAHRQPAQTEPVRRRRPGRPRQRTSADTSNSASNVSAGISAFLPRLASDGDTTTQRTDARPFGSDHTRAHSNGRATRRACQRLARATRAGADDRARTGHRAAAASGRPRTSVGVLTPAAIAAQASVESGPNAPAGNRARKKRPPPRRSSR